MATHPEHHHVISFTLEAAHDHGWGGRTDFSHGRVFNGDLYLSAHDHWPSLTTATWISADPGPVDEISVGTHLEDFAAAPATPSGGGKVRS